MGSSTIERLSLDSTNVTDAGAKTLAGFRELKALNVYHTLFTEKGRALFRAAVPECDVVWDPLSSDPKRRRS